MIIVSTLLIVLGLIITIVMLKPLWIINYLAPRFHCTRIKDICYGQDPRQTLDMYLPKQQKTDDVIVFIHGGSWDNGHKNEYQFAGLALSELGYITVVPNYRLHPDVQFPQFINDVACAVANVPVQLTKPIINNLIKKSRVTQDTLNIILIGHSAGAHSAAMLAVDPAFLKRANANVSIKACIGLAGPYDLPLNDPLVKGKFDGVRLLPQSTQAQSQATHAAQRPYNDHQANPITLAHKDMPPMCLIHGDADTTVAPYHSARFAPVLEQLGVAYQYTTYPKVNHRHLIGGLSIFARRLNPVFNDIKTYLASIDH